MKNWPILIHESSYDGQPRIWQRRTMNLPDRHVGHQGKHVVAFSYNDNVAAWRIASTDGVDGYANRKAEAAPTAAIKPMIIEKESPACW